MTALPGTIAKDIERPRSVAAFTLFRRNTSTVAVTAVAVVSAVAVAVVGF